ncbi:MAG TPA: alpha/beta hydrolase-fold protein [Pirellulales bacterium]|nr:alpha/beta hydrolase-fold protein [Pirellulales bacterium]
MAGSGVWHEQEVAGHVCDVFEPAATHALGLVVIFLHDAGQRLADQPAMTAELDRHGLRVVGPRTGRSWWTDKIYSGFDSQLSTERYVLDRVVPDVAERWAVRPPAVGLLGVGMGGQGALRLALKHPRLFPVVAAISPAIDYYQRWYEEESLATMYPDAEAARQDSATLHVHPLNWPRNLWFACDPADPLWCNGADRLRMKLSALGIPFECDLETSAAGDRPAYERRQAPRAIDFLVERLEAESRRVV